MEEARRLAEQLNVGKPLGPNWVDKFLKENKLSFKHQPKIMQIDSLKDQLLEWYHANQHTGLVTSKKMMDAAKNIARTLNFEINITKGWIESFRRNKSIKLEEQTKMKNFPIVQDRLNEWYDIESQFREISTSEILERGKYLASKLDVAPAKITENFVSTWQRKYNILLTESPCYARRIKMKNDFETDLLKWYYETIQSMPLGSHEIINRATKMCTTEGYTNTGVKDKSWLESFKKRHGIHFSDQPFHSRKLKQLSDPGVKLEKDRKKRRYDNMESPSPPSPQLPSLAFPSLGSMSSMSNGHSSSTMLPSPSMHSPAFSPSLYSPSMPSPCISSPSGSDSMIKFDINEEEPLSHHDRAILDHELKKWFDDQADCRLILRPMLLIKARSILREKRIDKMLNDDWVKGFLRRHALSLQDQPIFPKLEALEEKLLPWIELNSSSDMRELMDEATRYADDLRIHRELITEKYLSNLVKRGTFTKRMAFITFHKKTQQLLVNDYNNLEHLQMLDSSVKGERTNDSIEEIHIPPPEPHSKAEIEILLWYQTASRKTMITRAEIIKQAREIYQNYEERPALDTHWVKAFLCKHDINLLNQHMVQMLRKLKKELSEWSDNTGICDIGKAHDFALSVACRLEIPTEKITLTYVKNAIKKLNDPLSNAA